MEQDEIILEEGELSNDSEHEYTPLERPSNYSNSQPLPRLPVNPVSDSEEEEYQSNDSDSDSSDPNVKKTKKPKIRLQPQPQRTTQRNKKYDIWSSRLQEETLVATLDNCDVVKKDRSRDVESYNSQFFENLDFNMFRYVRPNNKRTRQDRNNKNFRQKQRSHSQDKDNKGSAKVLSDLTVDVNSKEEDIAKDMAEKLSEQKEELILKVVNVMGKQKAMDIYNETKEIEAEGGMLIMNQTRRRTSGGIYFYLVRHDYHITLDQRNEIFKEDQQKFSNEVKTRRREKVAKQRQKLGLAPQKILPDLLTRAELLAAENPVRKIKETGDHDFVNPPPTPETDGYENSRDGMEGPLSPLINHNDALDNSRGKLNTYDDDFLDLGCDADMDLF